MSAKSEAYSSCKDIKREKPEMIVDQELADKIGRNYRILPIFQQGLFENTLKKHYSLETNELLKCRWREYKKSFDERVFAPFEFLDIRDYHFHNQRNQLLPSVSIHTKSDHRKSLKPGPSVDDLGARPTPQELLMRRSGTESADPQGRQGKTQKKEFKPFLS